MWKTVRQWPAVRGRPVTITSDKNRALSVVALLVVGGVSPAVGQGLAFANARVSTYSAHAL